MRILGGGRKKALSGAKKCIGIYPGQYYDVETGLHYNYYRYFDSSTGRYLTPDPIGLAADFNIYIYVGNNAESRIDPSALLEVPRCAHNPGCKKCSVKFEEKYMFTGKILGWVYEWDWSERWRAAAQDTVIDFGKAIMNVLDKSPNPAALNPSYFIDNNKIVRPFLPPEFTVEAILGTRWPIEEHALYRCMYELCEDCKMMTPVLVGCDQIKGADTIRVLGKMETLYYINKHRN